MQVTKEDTANLAIHKNEKEENRHKRTQSVRESAVAETENVQKPVRVPPTPASHATSAISRSSVYRESTMRNHHKTVQYCLWVVHSVAFSQFFVHDFEDRFNGTIRKFEHTLVSSKTNKTINFKCHERLSEVECKKISSKNFRRPVSAADLPGGQTPRSLAAPLQQSHPAPGHSRLDAPWVQWCSGRVSHS